MYGTCFKKKWWIRKHLQKRIYCFGNKDINISDIFYKIQKFLGITTNGLNFLMAGPFFHKCDITNTTLVFIHVKKTFIALQCQMCGTYFKKKRWIRKHLQKKHNFLGFLFKDIKFQTYLQNSKVPRNLMGHLFWRQRKQKYWCYYLHRSRDSVSPVCGIFIKQYPIQQICKLY